MGFSDSSKLMKAAVILQFGAIILEAFGIGLPFWIYTEKNSITMYFGLWKKCTLIGESSSCKSLVGGDVEDFIQVVRGIEMAGMALLLAAVAATLIVLFLVSDKKMKKKVKILAWLLSFFAGGFIIVGILIFAEQTKTKDYHGAFVITIIAGVVALFAAVAGLLDFVLIQLLVK